MEVIRYNNGVTEPVASPGLPPDKGTGALVLPGEPSGGDEIPLVLPALFDGKGDNDAFVLPGMPDDQPLVLPGLEAVKDGDQPLVLPGAGEDATPLFVDLEGLLPLSGDWMLTIDGEPAARHDDWM